MYEQFFGLTESPFNVTPNPRFLFRAACHAGAVDVMLFGIRQRRGFAVLTGDVGTGKTTLCRALLEALDADCRTALILNPSLSESQFLRAVLIELGVHDARGDKLKLRSLLNDLLLHESAGGRDVVLVVDEAQHLSLDMLEQVRLLSNLETDDRKLLQVVLVGQMELEERLAHTRLRQLRQRISVRYRLSPLTPDETGDYIRHRLHVAGGNGRPAFEPAAVRMIHERSRGVPRLINAISEMSLLAGYAAQSDTVTAQHVASAVADLEDTLT